MVADNNKQPASENTTPAIANVGGGGQVTSGGKFAGRQPKFTKKNLLLGIMVLVILVGGGLIIKNNLHLGKKVYAEAAGHKIYKEDVKKLIGNTEGVSDHDAAVVLADKYLTEAMVKEAGITVTQADLNTQYPGINNDKNRYPYAYQSKVNTVYFGKLDAYNHGLYKGKVLVANFSRYIAFDSPFLGIQKATDPRVGNTAAVAADKKYAHDFINRLYNQIKSHQLTFDQAILKEQKDPMLGRQAYQTLPHSGSFDTSDVLSGGTTLIAPQSIRPKISKMQAGDLSKPFAVRVNNTLTGKNKKTVESYYLVVKMDYTKSSHSGLSYDEYIAQAKERLGYKVNV